MLNEPESHISIFSYDSLITYNAQFGISYKILEIISYKP